mgnify:CR=1 FL=1
MKQQINKTTAACAAIVLLLLTACSNNNVRNNDIESDTNTVDTRRNTDTTSNYITGDSGNINLTPATDGVGLDQ